MTDATKSIDWPGLLKLTNNRPTLAHELLTMFAAELPILLTAINDAFKNSDFVAMKEQVHKLHGSCCYTGVPRMKLLTQQLEVLLHGRNHTVIETVLKQLNQETQRVLTSIREQSYVNQ